VGTHLGRRRRPASDPESIERADCELLAGLEREWDRARARAGAWLRCAPGCAECCHGPFPITPLDAARLRAGLAALRSADPARAAAVLRRARSARAALTPDFPGDAGSGRLRGSEVELDAYLERHAPAPCPALDPAAGTCDLYAWRPVTCRTHGPPARYGGEDVAPCRLCFVGAAPADIEGCRIVPDRGGLEAAILAALGDGAHEEDGETLIAFALTERR